MRTAWKKIAAGSVRHAHMWINWIVITNGNVAIVVTKIWHGMQCAEEKDQRAASNDGMHRSFLHVALL